jgi:riboflavin synthase
MFTGIIEATGKVKAAKKDGSLVAAEISIPRSWKLPKGASVAVDGVCLTVTRMKPGSFSADLMPETLRKTTGAMWRKGQAVNLERPVPRTGRLDGHLIYGHVEGRAVVTEVKKEGRSLLLSVRLPRTLLSKAALHGSIAINGVSLTVARKKGAVISVALVPYTLAHTNLGNLMKGESVNIETDILARVRRPRAKVR